jgi:methyl-accepting chemotaxis protein
MSKLPNLFRFTSWPIATKLIVVMVLIAALPAAIISFVISSQNTRATTIEVQSSISNVTSDEDTYIETWAFQRQQEIRTLASLARVRNYQAAPDLALQAVKEQFNIWGVYEGLSIIDMQGIINISSAGTKVDVSDRPYFKEALTGKDVISEPLVSKRTGSVVVSVVSPIVVDGKVVGVALGTVPVTAIGDLLNKLDLGTTGEAYLINATNQIVTPLKFEKDLVAQGKLKQGESAVLNYSINSLPTTLLTPGFQNGDDIGGVQQYKDFRGKEVLGGFNYVSGLNLGLIVERETSEVYAPIVQANTVATAATLAAILLAILVAFLLSRSLTTQVRYIMNLFGEIGIGNFTARAQVVSEDELGTMAISLNAVLDNILTLIQTREQRDEIQTAIMKLLDEVAGVADGDLTREAEVTAEMTGAIADSFNYMIGQLRQIIKTVQSTTQEVSGSASEIRTTAEHLSQGSEDQAHQIVETSKAVQEMSASIAQVSENAALSASVSQQALTNAQQGARAVENTIQGMNRIRDQVQETAKRIKRLGESSQEIGEIVQLIEDIADRTSILALNASIQAAMAGEAGRGFAVVAEEVERLAERSTAATKQISTLIKTTQSETNEAVSAMETTTREVVDGSRLADQAGKALSEIESVSNQLAELIQSISAASKQQSRGSENLARSMMDISEVTQQTAAGTRQAAVSINELAALADQLRASVSRFKLPSNGNGNGHSNN